MPTLIVRIAIDPALPGPEVMGALREEIANAITDSLWLDARLFGEERGGVSYTFEEADDAV